MTRIGRSRLIGSNQSRCRAASSAVNPGGGLAELTEGMTATSGSNGVSDITQVMVIDAANFRGALFIM